MGLFSAISAVNELAKNVSAVNELAKSEEVRSAISNVANQGFNKLNSLFDSKDDEDNSDSSHFSDILEYTGMVASVLGQAALADGVVNEEEEDEAWELLEEVCFGDEGVFTTELLESEGVRKKDIKKELTKKFNKPNSLKKIAKYAIDTETEEDFYEMGCLIVASDNDINEEEKEFIAEFAEILELSRFDVKRLNKKHLKQ